VEAAVDDFGEGDGAAGSGGFEDGRDYGDGAEALGAVGLGRAARADGVHEVVELGGEELAVGDLAVEGERGGALAEQARLDVVEMIVGQGVEDGLVGEG